MTLKKLLKLVNKHEPENYDDFKRIGIKLIELSDNGAFREVYYVKGLNIVVKIPRDLGTDYDHAVDEIKAIKKLHGKKYRKLWKFLPKIYYANKKNGVIIMRRYKTFDFWFDDWGEIIVENTGFNAKLANLLDKLNDFDVNYADVEVNNCGATKGNQIKILDFGCFHE